MADQDMRLRLVVRRNGLPELRLMWHVHLDSNPTISKLLEQLNDQVPLESDHWGLEDYVVELHDGDGTDFECLHYQLVRTVLKPDDRVFIRALDHDDHRRRRISGRHQISSDGRHLIDGVPFGRPHLRITTGRPSIYIPPPKRARLTYSQQDGNDVDRDTEAEASSPVLLLTNGEPYGDKSAATGDFGNLDSDDADDTDFIDHDAEPSSPRSSGSELHGDEDEGDDDTDDEIGDETGEDDEDEDEDEDEDLDQEVRDLAFANATLEGHDPPTAPAMNLNALDKLAALRATFPTAPIDLCEKVLAASKGNLKTTYSVLSEAFNAEMSRAAIITWKPGVSHPGVDLEPSRAPAKSTSTYGTASRPSTRKRKLKEQSSGIDSDHDEDGADNNSLWQKYDHTGFPPGTITSGKGLAHMAAISGPFGNHKTNGNSESTSTTLKAPTEEPIEQDDDDDDDDTSSSGSSSGSSTSTDESEDASDRDSSSGNLSSQPSSSDSSDSDSESSDDSIERPKSTAESNQHASSSSTSGSDASDGDSDSGSDSGPEEYSFRGTSHSSLAAANRESNVSSESSDDTSDSESTGADSSSSDSEEDDSDEAANHQVIDAKKNTTVQAPVQPRPSPKPTRTSPAPILVPPGAGMEKTKRRNARRRAAKLTKRKMQEFHVDSMDAAATEPIQAGTGNGDAINNEAALFEAKRKALLDAIATGGIEVGPSGETTLDHGFVEADRVKRKRTKKGGTGSPHAGKEVAVSMANEPSGDDQEESANQKRRRVDLGAGRRLVFGALGLRNPKNKEDEDKLRDKLQTDAQLHANRQPDSQPQPSKDELVSIDDEQDPDAWKLKINYRAVECCHDNVELSPAPFPFQQRWDPQQQNYPAFKRNKRGGQGKRAQRDQSHYYGDRSSGKKRKRYETYGLVDDGYNDIHDKEDDTTIAADVTLNYDDIESQGREHSHDMVNETSQTTDFDDLPSIPKDISALPILRPGEAQVGMVISWLKWTCSSVTSWQPQLSRVAAIVVQVDDDDTALDVCLAKRDRYLDENEKRYDYRTGQRIYDRFEAPDLDEEGEGDDHADAGVDEGYRHVPWAEMNDPRILQQPLDPTTELKPNAKCITSVETDETTMAMENHTKPTVPLVSGQQESDPERVPTTNEGSFPIGDVPKSNGVPEGGLGGSGVKPYVKAASNSTPYQAEQNQPATDLATSDTSQISSPSRQLHETASQAMSSNSPIRNWAPASSVELGESPRPHSSSPMPPPATSPSQPCLEEEFGADIMTGTPKAVLPQAAIHSSSSSIRSGRQPDYAMNADSHALDPFDATDDLDHQSYDSEHNTPQPGRSSLTPIATHRPVTPGSNEQGGGDKATGSSPLATPTSGSLSSLSSLWCTAVTSHSTQSPSRALASSVISKPSGSRFSRDTQYEEAMRKLDEQLDEQLDTISSPVPASSSLEVKREDSTQVPARTLEAISPPPKRRFTLPPATQVIELSSDSEPAYSEDYADDEIDGTYTPDTDGLPKGAGWVKKGRDDGRRKARKSAV